MAGPSGYSVFAAAALGLAALGGQAAQAQTPKQSAAVAISAPRTAASADVGGGSPAARWLCAGGLEMDIRPVSYDGAASGGEWVVVYKRDGVAFSAERMDRQAAAAVPTVECRRGPRVG